MIRLLKGSLEFVDTTHIIVDVHGVGYSVYASHDVLSKLPAIGEEMKVFTYTHVREDILELYGFATMEDLKLFESFLGVSGIGPKTAIGIFAAGSRQQIMQAIQSSDVAFFSRVPRLGKKNAQKLILELKGKLPVLDSLSTNGSAIPADDEVVIALKSFGFSSPEISDALSKFEPDSMSVSEKVRKALKYLGK